jgi:hypothetical protein
VYNWQNIGKSASSPGIASIIYIIAIRNIDVFGIYNSTNSTAQGASVIVDTDHIPVSGQGFITMYSTQKFSEMKGETTGETDSRSMKIKVSAFSPGLSEAQSEFYKNALNEEGFIILVKDADCSTGKVYQVGTHCSPAEIMGSFESGNKDGGKKAWNFEFEALNPFLSYYAGNIILMPVTPILSGTYSSQYSSTYN